MSFSTRFSFTNFITSTMHVYDSSVQTINTFTCVRLRDQNNTLLSAKDFTKYLPKFVTFICIFTKLPGTLLKRNLTIFAVKHMSHSFFQLSYRVTIFLLLIIFTKIAFNVLLIPRRICW